MHGQKNIKLYYMTVAHVVELVITMEVAYCTDIIRKIYPT